MAGFSISTVWGKLKSFLSSMTSPIKGFDVGDVKVNTKEDSYAALFQLNASTGEGGLGDIKDINGESISLNILLKAINAKTVFAPIFDGLNTVDDENDSKDTKDLFNLLLGNREPDSEYKIDNSLESAEARGKGGSMKGGLLGVDLMAVANDIPDAGLSYKGTFWSWKNIAEDLLRYSLECESPGKDYGAIEDQDYNSCSKLISEYLVTVDLITSIEEVNIQMESLVLPILVAIQGKLKEYYSAAYEKYDYAKYIEPTYEELTNQDEYNQAQVQQAQAEQQEIQDQAGDNLLSNAEQAPYRPGASQSQAKGVFPGMSTQIKVKLKKVMGSSQIGLLGLETNGTPADTLNYIDDIINQDDFLNVITEEPQTFSIDVGEDGYEIEQCEDCEFDPCKSLEEVFKSGIRAYRNLYTLHWMANGNDMMKLHNLTEDMYKELIDEIDVVGELLVEKCGTVPSLDFPCDYIPVQQYDFQTGLDQIKSLISMYIDCIDCSYPNQTSDVQSTLDEWLRYWNKQLNYFVKGQEI